MPALVPLVPPTELSLRAAEPSVELLPLALPVPVDRLWLVVDDGALTAEQSFTISVGNVNDAPVFIN